MTYTLTDRRTQANARGGWGRSLAYAALLTPVSLQTMLGRPADAGRRWQHLARAEPSETTAAVSRAKVYGYGAISALLGLTSWFLLFLIGLAVVRGPFWGFVEHGVVEPGTWGGPSRTGAWAVHGAVAVPAILLFLGVLRGLSALQQLLVRPLYGRQARWWVLPATILLATGSALFFWSWLQQL
ncbi:hypothetical protein [Kribbella solani]|uniref:Uncharacterized protein n=1 Tax=Kribbella solani TaxID=236067 RepID=A0A841DLB8_9ACTN|nr:hypothetical protein [Kribbella solani]MBB5977227.1 hypothetical protein [Kribbella solani]